MKSPRLIAASAALLIVFFLLLSGRKPPGGDADFQISDNGQLVLPESTVETDPPAPAVPAKVRSTEDVPLKPSVVRLVQSLDRGVPVQLTVEGQTPRTLLLRPRKLLADNFKMSLGVGGESEAVLDPQIVRTYGGRTVSAGGKLDERANLVVVDNAVAGSIESGDGSLLQFRTDDETGELLTLEVSAEEQIGTCEHDPFRNIATTYSDHEPFTDEDWLESPRAVLAAVDGNDPEILNAGGVNPANGRLDKYMEPLPLGQNYALSLRDLISLIVLDKGSTGANTTTRLTNVASEYLARMANVASVHEHQLGVRTLVQELILTPNTDDFTDVPAGLADFRTWVGNNRPRGTYRWNNAAKFDGTSNGAIGIAYVSALNSGSAVSINNRGFTHALVAHEMGHNMGSGHSDGGIMNPSIITGSRDFFRDVSAGETAAKDIYDHSGSRLYGSVSMRHPEQIPFAQDDDRTTGAGSVHVFNPVANDDNVVPNGTANSVMTLEEVSVVQPLNAGTVEITGPNEVTFTPAAGFEGISWFSYSVRGNVGNGGRGWLHKGDAAVQVGSWNANSLNLSLAPGQVFSMRPSGGGDVSIQSRPRSAYAGTSRDDRQLIIIRVEAGATGSDSFVYRKNGSDFTVNITYIPVSEYLVATPDVFYAEGATGTIEFDPLINDQGGGYRSPVTINPILNGADQTITYYFRHRFDVADPSAFSGLNLELLRDDGAVVYLNGTELVRDNMASGTVSFDTLASGTAGGAEETTYYQFNGLPVSALVAGSNVLAVEVHQASANSSDVSFDLSLTGAKTTGNELFVPRGSSWRYLDDGSDQGTAWREPEFTDNGGFTIVSFGPDSGDKHITTYFRKKFEVENPGSLTGLTIRARRDDGIVVYLNGAEVARDNMPSGAINYLTEASSGAGDDGEDYQEFSISTVGLVNGTNQLAVEIHQTSPTSSDITFDLELTGSSAGGDVLLVGAGTYWKYLDNGSNQGSGWRSAAYNDAAWASGPAPLGYPAVGTVWPEGAAILGFGDGNETTTLSDAGDGLALLAGALRVVSATNLTPEKGSLTFNETRPFTVNGNSTDQLTGRMSYTPAGGATGIAQVEYVIEDGAGNQTTGSVIIVLPLVDISSPVTDDVIVDLSNGLVLSGVTYDGGQPPLSGTVTPAWSLVEGPEGGVADFEDPGQAETVVRFNMPGDYVIRLTGDDNGYATSRERRVRVVDAGADEGTAGLLGWWKLDETSGSVHADSSGNGHTGVRVNNPEFTSGIIDGALEFSASDRYVDLSAHVPAFKDLVQGSITVWFQANTGSMRTIFSASDSGDPDRDLRVYIDDGRLKYKLRGDVGTSESSVRSDPGVNDNEWHHAAVTVDAAQNMTLYLDGEVVSTGVRAFFSGLFDIDSMSIGRTVHNGSSDEPFRGRIDDLRIYQRVLEAEEVVALAGVAKNHAPLVALPDTSPVTGAATIPASFLNPSVTDDGGVTGVFWKTVSGPGMAGFSNVESLNTNITFPSPGVYTLQLAAGDGEATTVDTVSITYTGAGNGVPFALGLPDQRVHQNATPAEINLFDAFADGQDADTALVFSVTGNTNPALFNEVTVVGVNPKRLRLDYAAATEGVADITVRATDSGGLFVESAFRVTVENFRPMIRAQILTVAEDAQAGDLAGTINGSDSDGDAMSFALLSGNEVGDFVIEPSTGRLRVSSTARLDFETRPGYSFQVAVTDAEHPDFVSIANVSVNVSDVNEAPVMSNQFFEVSAGAANGSVAGTVESVDPEGRDLNLVIVSGNISNAFRIEDGLLTVNNAAAVDLGVTSQFVLQVTASDDGAPSLSDTAEIRVTVKDTLLSEGAAARAFVPTDGSVDSTWYLSGFNDSSWTAGNTGVGYDTDGDYNALIGIDVEAEMSEISSSAYVRVPFTVANPAVVGRMILEMKYDDGFVAWINGQEIARRNAPAGLAWDSNATDNHDDVDAQIAELIDVSQFTGALVAGDNVLAIHGLNAGETSSDLLMLPRLTVSADVPGPPVAAILPAANVTENSALLSAEITDTGGDNPSLTFVWGASDGGDNPAEWEFSEVLSPRPAGTYFHTATGLIPGVRYFSNVIASSAGGTVTGGDSETFTTGFGDPVVLIPEGAPASGLVPVNGSVDSVWRGRGFDDAGWKSGSLAAGYDTASGYDGLIGGSLDFETEMYNQNTSLYLRVPFIPSNPGVIRKLVLRMKYDDGFVAWLNGIEVARRVAADGEQVWSSAAAGQHPDAEATVFEDIDISGFAGLLTAGVNVLAIQGLNDGADSSDMLISPELLGYTAGLGPAVFYDTWASANNLTGAAALTGADFDKDGLSNLLEYAFNTDPAGATGGTHSVSLAVNGRLRVSYVRRTDAAARGLTYRVDADTGLDDWQPAVIEAVEGIVPNGDGETETVTVRLAGTGDVQFARIVVVYAP